MHRTLLLIGCLLQAGHWAQAAEWPLMAGRCFTSQAPRDGLYLSQGGFHHAC
ncbi:hypothetical protein PBOI14_39220 [Pseudomonas sp. Boi14]|nr:hypothetical protein PBOI14_39220 [Pseudomonas sp. Boi14]